MNVKKLLLPLLILLSFAASAQNAEMADRLRENGKIYVVISVIALIFIALVIYLAILDKKISRLEKELRDK